ncbi:MAG: UDP-2,3-diacylglucosamine diphosphatase LpxI [Planctomycetota bacterium]|nr:UDP-2,3-diacylglucosamine diphosphatase LpxI [Planctomycetota bacterium]
MHDTPVHLGLIAGQGRLPILVARGMKAAGATVCCVGLRDQFDADLPGACDIFRRAGIVRIGRWIRILRRAGVEQAVMVGRVEKARMHDPLRLIRQMPDWRAVNIWYRRLRHDRRNAALLAAVADELASSGITLIDSTMYIPDHLAAPGTMGAIEPSAQAQADIDFGWPLLEKIVALDVGQSIAVRDRDVIAVEAVEGTDGLIERAGTLCRARGWTLLKTSRPDHDMRADVPTIGVDTVQKVADSGGRCIAVGAGRVILIDRPQVIEAADRAKVALVGVS